MKLPLALPGLEPVGHDVFYSGLRFLALGVAGTYAAALPGTSPHSGSLLVALLVFAAYSTALAWWGRGEHPPRQVRTLYLFAAALDLIFVTLLLDLTGGAESPFYRALYVWVAMVGFRFGLLGGGAAAVVSLLLYLGFQSRHGGVIDPWLVAVQAGGLLLHGPLVGFVSARARQRIISLELARQDLERANLSLAERQAALIQAEKLATAGIVAAGIAHEVKNPLAGVISCVGVLRAGQVPPERQATYLDAMVDGLERMRLTVQGLLDYARQHPPAPETLDGEKVVAACLGLLVGTARGREVTLESRLLPGQLAVWGDRWQVMQALFNVLLNAVDASPPGERVVIDVITRGSLGGLTVRDFGPGIPPEQVGKVCEPFFSTKPAGVGTGLGLSITRDILQAHGGHLEFDAPEGGGARVILWLPLRGEA